MSSVLAPSQTSTDEVGLQPQEYLKAVKDLTQIFPDIEGELCSRHSTLMGKLKNTFNKLYDHMEPSQYIIVKGNTHIIGTPQDEVALSMGLENGIILLITPISKKGNIYINGNHMEEQLILDCNGKLQQGLYQMSDEIQNIWKCALKALHSRSPQMQPCGAIVYIHANIPQGLYNYKNSLLTSIYLGCLIANNNLSLFSIPELIENITSSKLVDQCFLEKSFYDYENRQFSLMVGSSMFKVKLDPSVKLLFCRMDLATCDITHSQNSLKEIRDDKEKIIQWMDRNYGVKSFYQAFQNQLQVDLSKLNLSGINNQTKMTYMKLADAQMKELKFLCEYSNKNLTIQDLLTLKWEIDSKVRQIFSEEVTDLVENIKSKSRIQACTIVQNEYIIIAVDRRKYTEMICILRQLLHKGELKSRSFFKLEEQLVENRWGSDEQIGQKIFVSVPSKGISVFDPSEAIWFD